LIIVFEFAVDLEFGLIGLDVWSDMLCSLYGTDLGLLLWITIDLYFLWITIDLYFLWITIDLYFLWITIDLYFLFDRMEYVLLLGCFILIVCGHFAEVGSCHPSDLFGLLVTHNPVTTVIFTHLLILLSIHNIYVYLFIHLLLLYLNVSVSGC
jgi:hypothetical protein